MLERAYKLALLPVGLHVLGVHQLVYEATDGRLGSRIGNLPMLLLRTTGRQSGLVRTSVLLYGTDRDRLVVVASRGGSDQPPAWFLNLQAEPEAEVQVGRERFRVRARVTAGQERGRLWRMMNRYWNYDGYQARTDRKIPVVVLEPQG